jgi:nicotinamide/nicotinate riboside kinase
MELVPIHPVHNVQDWDAAPGAIDWDRLIASLKHMKSTGTLPDDHRSHDHLNEQKKIPVEKGVDEKWTGEFKAIQKRIEEEKQERVIFGILDGFLLYWHPVSLILVLLRAC